MPLPCGGASPAILLITTKEDNDMSKLTWNIAVWDELDDDQMWKPLFTKAHDNAQSIVDALATEWGHDQSNEMERMDAHIVSATRMTPNLNKHWHIVCAGSRGHSLMITAIAVGE